MLLAEPARFAAAAAAAAETVLAAEPVKTAACSIAAGETAAAAAAARPCEWTAAAAQALEQPEGVDKDGNNDGEWRAVLPVAGAVPNGPAAALHVLRPPVVRQPRRLLRPRRRYLGGASGQTKD